MAISIHRPGEDGHSIELVARRPGVEKPLSHAFRHIDHSFRAFMRMARMGKHARPKPVPLTKAFLQRCAVQIRYTKSGSVGKWYSHGSYIGRESKKRDERGRALGFGSAGDSVSIAATVAGWRKEQDETFFRVILSPERGDRMDLEAHTREVGVRVANGRKTGVSHAVHCLAISAQPLEKVKVVKVSHRSWRGFASGRCVRLWDERQQGRCR
jgi:hypothetical protein